MNFRKLPKEKKNHLVLVGLVTLIAVAGLYFGLIKRQHESLAQLKSQREAATKKLKVVLDSLHRADAIQADLEIARTKLAAAETDVASGDLYAWVINSLRQFKSAYKVEIPQYGQLGAPTDVTIVPNFPYKQATLTVAGSAHFYDLGLFLADFENRFPHVRLTNLSVDTGAAIAEPEMLSFKMDIITLVKVNPS
jgi:hypothetical protein